jgi:5'-phosphate synthase pdxT subunit
VTRIGVLALQGDFREHIQALERLGVLAHAVRLPRQLEGVDGVVIPGGESTVMGKLMVEYQLDQPLRDLLAAGTPVWGTCAGMVLLARETDRALSGQPLLAAMHIRVTRNAFGAQRESFETDLRVPALGERPFHAVFIRAPAVLRADADVEVLARLDDGPIEMESGQDTPGDNGANGVSGTIVAVREGKLLATAFHPEVTDDLRFHEYFLDLVRGSRG